MGVNRPYWRLPHTRSPWTGPQWPSECASPHDSHRPAHLLEHRRHEDAALSVSPSEKFLMASSSRQLRTFQVHYACVVCRTVVSDRFGVSYLPSTELRCVWYLEPKQSTTKPLVSPTRCHVCLIIRTRGYSTSKHLSPAPCCTGFVGEYTI